MAEVEKLEANIELKSPAEKFYKFLKSEYHVPKTCSYVQSIEVQEGDWETPGSVKLWNYSIDGKAEIAKEKLQVDEANKTLTFEVIEGHVLELYKTFKVIIKVESTGLAKLTVEHEKVHANVPTPNKHMKLLGDIIIKSDNHVSKGGQ